MRAGAAPSSGRESKAPGIMLRDLGQGRQAARVALNRHHLSHPGSEERAGEAAWPGADLDDRHVLERPGGARHPARQVEVEQEVLAERLLRHEPVPTHDLAERRQAVDRAHAAASAGRAARRAARRSAAMRLSGRATPLPAMSKAVPWSGEVRMKGSPRVTFTPSSKAMVLIGISAWSWYMQSATS